MSSLPRLVSSVGKVSIVVRVRGGETLGLRHFSVSVSRRQTLFMPSGPADSGTIRTYLSTAYRRSTLIVPRNPSKHSKVPGKTFSSSSSGNKGSSSARSILWQVATLGVVGTTFVVVGNYFSHPSWRYGSLSEADDKPISPQAEITSHVYFDIAIQQQVIGRVIIGLYGNVVPKTTNNFETICKGDTKIGNVAMTYEGTAFHRIIPGFMCQAGEKPGRSIYQDKLNAYYFDGRFKDENFQLTHAGPGVLSMANSGPNTNTSQFFITTARTGHLDGKHVVFGVVLDGWDIVRDVEACGSANGKPILPVTIAKCGILNEQEVTEWKRSREQALSKQAKAK